MESLWQSQAVYGSKWQNMAVVDSVAFTAKYNYSGYKSQCMSSNIRVTRICENCKQSFTAKRTTTRFCSHICNGRFVKAQAKQDKIELSNLQTRQTAIQNKSSAALNTNKELLNVKELAIYTTLSERTLFRLVKDTDFPKLKVRNRLLFNKVEVMNYLTNKYGSL